MTMCNETTDGSHFGGTNRPGGSSAKRQRTRHDWTDSQSVVTSIIDAICEVDPTFEPTSAESLQSSIDVDALEQLFDRTRAGNGLSEGTVSFRYDSYWITVSSDGVVTVQEYVRNGGGTGSPE